MEHLFVSKVYIVIVNWNGWKDTIECLESLMLLEYPGFRIVVCDNGSPDESVVKLSEWIELKCGPVSTPLPMLNREAAEKGTVLSDSIVTLITNGANLGFAGGNNVGLRYAMACGDADYCWLLNNDTIVKPDTLTHMVDRMHRQPEIGICGSTVLYYNNHKRIQALGGGYYVHWIGLPWHYGRFIRWGREINHQKAEAKMNYVEGASMLVSRQFLEGIGLLCEDYFLYFEEADWAIRAEGRFELGYAPLSVVFHKVGSSIGTSSNPAAMSYTSDYFNIRNRLLFTRRFYPEALPTVWLVVFGAFLLRLLLGKWDRAAMIFRLMFNSSNCVK